MRTLFKTLLLGILLSGCGGFALAYEEPGYTVVKQYQEFELRQYDAYLVAETSVAGDFADVGGEAFRRLFDYISAVSYTHLRAHETRAFISYAVF